MLRPLKILMAEDNPLDAELVLNQIRSEGFDPKWERVETEAEFVAKLRPGLDLILSDFQMPQFTGLQALELLKKSGLDIPFILMSGTIGEDTAVLAMKAGASDYLLKDRLARLGPAIDHALKECRLRKERLQAMEALRLFRSLVDQSSDSFEVMDPETARFIDVNEKGFSSMGYSREEFLTLRLFDIDPTMDAASWPQMVAKIRAGGQVSGEGRHRRKDGTEFPIEFNVKFVKLDREYLVAVVRDITERKEMEALFFRAQRLDSIGSMASGIAHDMNNILAPILMSAPMLRLGMSPENTERTLNAIEQSAKRGADLVRQLLTFGRGTDGARNVIQPGVLVREMANIAQQTFPKNISIVEEISGNLWPIVGDPTQLHQVLLNLCVNARDAMPKGGTLTISATNFTFDRSMAAMMPGAAPGAYVMIQVADTGTGIPSGIVDQIFDPFFTTKAVGKGTGLGLSTVIGIAKSHGGLVNLRTAENKGSVFQVYLPAKPESKARDVVAPADASPCGQGELVLVVDDEANIRDLIRNILVSHGYKAITANDGAEATTQYALHRDEIKAVITDLDMPVMDGMMLIHVLKTMNPEVAVIVSSGVASRRGMEARKVELELLGIGKILKKPYTVERILKDLHQLLHRETNSPSLPVA
jgi:two-component system, cell cycle sensor histidine kinase and response regulator CckA